MRNRLVFSFVVLVGMLGILGDPFRAIGGTTLEIANPELSVPGATGGCGQSCLYLKANDVLGMQALYLQKMAQNLINLREKRANASEDEREQIERELSQNLSPFCRTQRINLGDSWGPEGDKCLASYLQTVGRSMEMIRSALVKNYSVVSQLADGSAVEDSKKKTEDPKTAQRVLKDPARAELKKLKLYPDFPLLPSLDSIDPIIRKLGDTARFRIQQRKAAYSTHEQQKADEALAQWWDQFPRCPAPDEFARVELVERYPSHPTGEKLPRIVYGANGKIEIDQAKYLEALKICNEKKKSHFQQLPLPDEFLEKGATRQARQAFKSAQEEMVSAVDRKVREVSTTSRPGGADHVTLLGQVKGGSALGGKPGAVFDQMISEIKNSAAKYRGEKSDR
ncbi:hypothetical protein EBZ37_03115 [bacterium]|nr:hypothetical protein [bacterium]